MTKKDYIKLAQALKDSKLEISTLNSDIQWRETVNRIAEVLQDDNPRFDRKRFFDATGGF